MGHASRGGGTLAAVTALPLHWLFGAGPFAVEAAFALCVTFVGIWAAQKVADEMSEHDPQIVVIDEVAGALIALALARGHGVFGDLIALGLFRLFDIFKPWPVILFERIRHAGSAIMLDDVAAGVMAGVIFFIL